MFEPTGEQYATVDAFRAALRRNKALLADLGVTAEKPPLRDPASGDFRPAAGSAAIDRGVRVFVPWGLYGTVGEWHFTRKNSDPTRVIDEHWYMTDYYGARQEYKNTPRYRGVEVDVPTQSTGRSEL
jgi:hypothetical protein